MKIIIVGLGGQGIKLLGYALARILEKLNYNVSFYCNYDAAVRNQKIEAFIVYSKDEIINPFFEEADILVQLGSKEITQKAKTIIIEKDICGIDCINCKVACKNAEQIPFFKMSREKFKNNIFINMIALGKILKDIGIDIDQLNLEEILPEKYIEENIEAIRLGYEERENL